MADLTPARLADLRSLYFRAPTVLALLDEIDRLRADNEELQHERLRAVIRETHNDHCVWCGERKPGGYEIEP